MRHRILKLGLVAATALSAALPLLATPSAFADYAPSNGDVVGVGSDTLQYALDFVADGDAYADPGYNEIGNKNKLVSFDATGDANARLQYGVNGGQATQTVCTPGTGSAVGTGNATGTNTGVPCVLNPTVVLRAETQPVQRPNGSGSGFKALVQDVLAGNNAGTSEVINFARASSAQTTAATLPAGQDIDQIEVATDTLPMLVTKTPATHAVPLSATQLSLIYSANTGSCLTWSDPRISGVVVAGAATTSGSVTVSQPAADVTAANVGWVASGPGIPSGDTVAASPAPTASSFTLTTAAGAGAGSGTVSLTNPAASTDAIIPIIPQVGSGTRSVFLGDLSPTLSNPGTCSVVAEENDPTALAQQSSPADAIEPISQGRLDLYNGVTSTGTSGGIGGYFLDPSCAYLSGTAACGTGSVSGDTWITNSVSPAVTPITTGTPAGIGGGLFNPTRPLYLYVRNGDIASTTPFQSPGTENWLNTLFYDPCTAALVAAHKCTAGAQFGPAGAPYLLGSEGPVLLEDSGLTPLNPEVCTIIAGTLATSPPTPGSC